MNRFGTLGTGYNFVSDSAIDCVFHEPPNDIRFVISSSDFNFSHDSTQKIVFALIVTNPDTVNACPGITFTGIKATADTAWNVYNNPPPMRVSDALSNDNGISIYPNPATNDLSLKANESVYNTCTITNSIGQILSQQNITSTQTTINVKSLPMGLYFIKLSGVGGSIVRKFVKE
jgi:hypothetical protein